MMWMMRNGSFGRAGTSAVSRNTPPIPPVGTTCEEKGIIIVRVVWDEQNLDFLEANKTPKQKINEPKTPYHAPEVEDGLVSPSPTDECLPMKNHIHAEAIRHALFEVAYTNAAGTSQPRNSGWTSSEDEAEEMDHDNEDASGRLSVSAGKTFQLGSALSSAMDMFPNHSDGSESNGRRWSFEEHRRAHYDEYRKAKMLAGHEISDEEEADMGGEDAERHQPRGSCSGQSQQDHESILSRSLGGIDLQADEM